MPRANILSFSNDQYLVNFWFIMAQRKSSGDKHYLIFNMLDYKYRISERCVITRRTTINNDS